MVTSFEGGREGGVVTSLEGRGGCGCHIIGGEGRVWLSHHWRGGEGVVVTSLEGRGGCGCHIIGGEGEGVVVTSLEGRGGWCCHIIGGGVLLILYYY